MPFRLGSSGLTAAAAALILTSAVSAFAQGRATVVAPATLGDLRTWDATVTSLTLSP